MKAVTKRYGKRADQKYALKHFDLQIAQQPAQVITIAGMSGSGKTTVANLILRLIHPTSGSIMYDGRDINQLRGSALRRYRREVQVVFQDPFTVFNPFYPVRHVFDLAVRYLSASREGITHALMSMGLDPDEVLSRYPHQLSGGQRQRVMLARAYLIQPRLLVADEPVSMVDTSQRSAILHMMLKLRDNLSTSIVYITHDLSTAYQISDQILVLKEGEVVERGSARQVILSPTHSYVQELVRSVPTLDTRARWADVDTTSLS